MPDFEKHVLLIQHKSKEECYPLITNSIFNIYNQLTAIALLRELGLSANQVQAAFSKLSIVESRYSCETVGGTQVITHMAKGQNPIACSCVFDYVRKEKGQKEVILMLDDVFDRVNSSEIMTWIYDADFEFLNEKTIRRIIISGVRCEDYKLRLLMTGISEEKLVCVPKEIDAPDSLSLYGTDKIFILHELYAAKEAMNVRDKTVDLLKNKSERRER